MRTRPVQSIAFLVVTMLGFVLVSLPVSAATGVAPVITSISPNIVSTSGGKVITIKGTNLVGSGQAVTVSFNGANSTGDVLQALPNQVQVAVPAHSAGVVDVTVTTNTGGTSTVTAADQITYTAAPIIYSVSPNVGPTSGNTVVTISGANLLNNQPGYDFKFGDADAFPTSASSTSATLASPAHAAGVVDVTATTSDGTSAITEADKFTYASGPVITSVTPDSGPIQGGTTVTVHGFNLFSNDAHYNFKFGTTNAFVNGVDGTTATIVAPAHVTGTVDITDTTTDGTSATSVADHFTYLDLAPQVTVVTPKQGPLSGGNTVVIQGENLNGVQNVFFGTTPSTNFFAASPNKIEAAAPAGQPGSYNITVQTSLGTSVGNDDNRYQYTAHPVINSISPSNGPLNAGNTVQITGFNLVAPDDTAGFAFDGKPATILHIEKSSDGTQTASVAAPAHDAGTVDVTDTTSIATSDTSAADKYTYVDYSPVIASVSPNAGSTSGGVLVTLTGTNLLCGPSTQIFFGGVAGVGYDVSPNTATVTSPAHAAGVVDITITGDCGQSKITTTDKFTYTDQPTITSVSPNTGDIDGGDTVTITGYNLDTVPAPPVVTFGGTPAHVIDGGPTTLHVTAPAHAAGPVDIVVQNAGNTSDTVAADKYTYADMTPVITSISPTSGPTSGDAIVTITGKYLNVDGNQADIKVGGTDVGYNYELNNDGTIDLIRTPAHTQGTFDIVVTTPYGTSAISAADKYTYVVPNGPTITSISPNLGPIAGGTAVTVTGTNLTSNGTDGTFKVGGIDAGFVEFNPAGTVAIISTPAHSAGAYDITDTTANGTSPTSSADQFTYQGPIFIAPAVTSVTPNSGTTAGGTTVSITGTNLTNVTGVSFDGVSALFKSNTDGTLTAVSPAHAAAVVDVKVIAGGATSAANASDRFTYIAPAASAPNNLKLNPTHGPQNGGTYVALSGSNLNNVTKVTVGGKQVSFTSVLSGNQKAIAFTTPSHAAGSVPVVVTTAAGSGTAYFTYDAPAYAHISSLSPSNVPSYGGTTVTVNGSNFVNVKSVKVGGSSVSYTLNSSSKITFRAPAHVVGNVGVVVTTGLGSSNTVNLSYYKVNAPNITNVNPGSVPGNKSTFVTLTGSDFAGATKVTVDGKSIAFWFDNGHITFSSPKHSAGAVKIVVTSPAGSSTPATLRFS